jgi:Bacterial archaeo-eukaryotic release factor family 10
MPVSEATWLRPLAERIDEHDAAITVYLDLSPSSTPTPSDLATRVRSAIDTLGSLASGRSGEAKRRIDAGIRRLGSFLEDEDMRGGGHVHGAALFADGDDVFRAMPLWRAVPDLTTAGPRFVLRPAAALASRTNDVLLVEAGRELGRVIAFDHGHVVDVADADDHIANRHSQGGWMQSRIQRDVDRQAELHLGEVVGIVERLHGALGRPPIVIAATEEHAATVRERMNEATASAVIGVLGNARDADLTHLGGEVRQLADAHDLERERALLDRRAEQLGREEVGNGIEGVLDAAYTGRIDTLLFARGADPDVFSCPQCGRLGAEARVCPYDETFMQHEPDGAEAVVSATLRADGTVWELMDTDRRDLDASGGLGVIVRY